MQPIDRIEQIEKAILAILTVAFGFVHPNAENTPAHLQIKDAMAQGVIAPPPGVNELHPPAVAEPIRPVPTQQDAPPPRTDSGEPFAPQKPGDI